MTGAEFVVATQALSLTTEQAAKWLGVHRSVAYRYANGSSPIPGPVARALRLAVTVSNPTGPVSLAQCTIATWLLFSSIGKPYAPNADVLRQINEGLTRLMAADLATLLAMEG